MTNTFVEYTHFPKSTFLFSQHSTLFATLDTIAWRWVWAKAELMKPFRLSNSSIKRHENWVCLFLHWFAVDSCFEIELNRRCIGLVVFTLVLLAVALVWVAVVLVWWWLHWFCFALALVVVALALVVFALVRVSLLCVLLSQHIMYFHFVCNLESPKIMLGAICDHRG